jgi:hypothetical protein
MPIKKSVRTIKKIRDEDGPWRFISLRHAGALCVGQPARSLLWGVVGRKAASARISRNRPERSAGSAVNKLSLAALAGM